MAQQLVLSIENTAAKTELSNSFRWCWLRDGQPQSTSSGTLEDLRDAIGNAALQAWLLLPGNRVVTREMEYSEKEKKHLRSLLPYQLEEAVIGDVEDFHFAFGSAENGKVTLAYTDKIWLKSIFDQVASVGLEISHCWSAPSLLPSTSAALDSGDINLEPSLDAEASVASIESTANTPTWIIAVQQGVANIRLNNHHSFSVTFQQLPLTFELMLQSLTQPDNLPFLVLRAEEQEELNALLKLVPEKLSKRVSSHALVDPWQLNFTGKAVDLCQAEFSQRLPLVRWWKLWSNVSIFALVTILIYMGMLMLHSYKLKKENLMLQQKIETEFRSVISNGRVDNPESTLRSKIAEMQPKTQTGSVVSLLAGVMPLIANYTDVSVKMISYSADTGEMNINIQAHSFNTIDGLRQSIASQGYNAELLTVNAQGDVNTARLKISKPAH